MVGGCGCGCGCCGCCCGSYCGCCCGFGKGFTKRECLRLPILVVWTFTLSYHILSQARWPGDCAAVCSRSASLHLATELLSALGRASKNRDFTASHVLGHLCFSWHVWSRRSFLRDLDLFLKLRHVEEFPGCPNFIWDIFSCRTREATFKSHAPPCE